MVYCSCQTEQTGSSHFPPCTGRCFGKRERNMTTYRAKGQGFVVKFNDLKPDSAILWAAFGCSAELVAVSARPLPVEAAKAEAVRIARLPVRTVQSIAVACNS